jgi:hypothetical protein
LLRATKWSGAVLPDGIFSNQKSQFVQILEGLAIVDVGSFMAILSIHGKMIYIFYGH